MGKVLMSMKGEKGSMISAIHDAWYFNCRTRVQQSELKIKKELACDVVRYYVWNEFANPGHFKFISIDACTVVVLAAGLWEEFIPCETLQLINTRVCELNCKTTSITLVLGDYNGRGFNKMAISHQRLINALPSGFANCGSCGLWWNSLGGS